MSSRKRERRGSGVRWPLAVILTAGLALVWLAGCQAQQATPTKSPLGGGAEPGAGGVPEIDPTTVETRDDIVDIVQYWNPEPWLLESGRPVGFRATVLFISGATGRGAFVPGNIMIWMYALEPSEEGMPKRTLLYGWEFTEDQSILYRVRKRSIQGYYYGFQLLWGPEVDALGKEVEFVVGYQRLDGRPLTAPGRQFRVPVPAGYRRPTSRPAREQPPPIAPPPERRPKRPAESPGRGPDAGVVTDPRWCG